MALTEAQVTVLRQYVGTASDEAQLEDLYALALLRDEPEPLKWVAASVLRQRLADFEASPASFGTDGLNIGTAANIAALQKRLTDLDRDTLDVAEPWDEPVGLVRTFRRWDWVR